MRTQLEVPAPDETVAGKHATGRRRTVIYGAGSAGRAAFARLAEDRSRRVVAFTDSDSRKHDTVVEGVRVVAVESLTGDWFDEIIVAVGHPVPNPPRGVKRFEPIVHENRFGEPWTESK